MKKLYMGQPLMDTMNYQGTIFSILSDEKKIMPWVYNNFIQLRYVIDWEVYCYDNQDIIVETCPFIKKNIIDRELVEKKWGSFVEFIKECIDTDSYVWCHLNRFYIPAHSVYKKENQFHETLVLGYDENVIYIADNLANGKYQVTECTYDEINDAFRSVDSPYDHITRVILLKKKEEDVYELNIAQIVDGIRRHLYSRASFDPVNYNVLSIYGLDVYKYLISRFQHHKHKMNKLDIRPFHLIWEHKKIMTLRLKELAKRGYLQDSSDVISRYTEIEQRTLILRNTVIKYNVSQSSSLLDKIESELRFVHSEERSSMEDLLNHLNML
ncbi:hypothetical protein [Paenibacillus xylanexedens]|uniref:hypothetical protein n=1 Tax=Paenibacillus xylanexedens TaxID=528191 RepID=UPI000F53800C|nr:hypothetical protein [Paenibacillus xylanexedens]RPK27816.1 hypothetical protein EDO6_03339 [Paenibacillus xylanexedens]